MELRETRNSREEKQTYTVAEVSSILGISRRAAYNYCSKTKDFRVIRLGNMIRIHQKSFDEWFYKY